jgi:ethanolamine utilization protein EutP
MKKIILVGHVACGKTTLCQRLNGLKQEYKKTQALEVVNHTIDTPGEYLEHRSFMRSLTVTAVEVDLALFLQDATSERFLFSPGQSVAFPIPVIGVVTKTDIATKEQTQQAVELLDQSGLAGTGSTDQANAFTGMDVKGDILQNLAFVGSFLSVGKAHIFDFHNGNGSFLCSRNGLGLRNGRILGQDSFQLRNQLFVMQNRSLDRQTVLCKTICQSGNLRCIHFDPLQQVQIGEDLFGRTLLYNLTLFHENDGIGIHNFVGMVGNKNHCNALFLVQMTDKLHHIPAGIGIQHSSGFVQNDAGSIGGDGACHGNSLLLTT